MMYLSDAFTFHLLQRFYRDITFLYIHMCVSDLFGRFLTDKKESNESQRVYGSLSSSSLMKVLFRDTDYRPRLYLSSRRFLSLFIPVSTKFQFERDYFQFSRLRIVKVLIFALEYNFELIPWIQLVRAQKKNKTRNYQNNITQNFLTTRYSSACACLCV